MGDVPLALSPAQPGVFVDHEEPANGTRSYGKILASPGEQPRGSQAPFYSQLETIPQAITHGPAPVTSYASHPPQYSMQNFDMGPVATALRDEPTSPARSFPSNAALYTHSGPAQSPTTMNFSPQSMPHYRGQPSFQNGFHIPPQHVQPHPHAVPSPYYSHYSTFGSHMPMRHVVHSSAILDTSYSGVYGGVEMPAQQMLSQSYPGLVGRGLISDPAPSYPRGPPRKPKQSGHALWVGNLPPGASIIALKDHFSREATAEIESLFLISKSNCAFVNYKTEEACAAAMARFHDSRFQGLRLVCRLRRGTASSLAQSAQSKEVMEPIEQVKNNLNETPEKPKSQGVIVVASSSTQLAAEADLSDGTAATSASTSPDRVPERYFVVKSLTLQDLEASVRNGIWSTQGHNEVALNNAFKSADNVYLVFSANKSGEYFGYARMTSSISTDPVTANPQSQPEKGEADNGPKSIPTPSTQWAPKGRIVDDSARGTIFWEADSSESDGVVEEQSQFREEPSRPKQGSDWGKPFTVEWISTNRLPFYRTRGLRNPWNENREVKIARDGTEIEPGIGQRLVAMFHRPSPAS